MYHTSYWELVWRRATGWTARFRFPVGARLFSSPQSPNQAQSAPLQWAPGSPFLAVKRPRREADHSPPSSAEVKNGGAIPPLPHLPSWHIYGSTALVDLGHFFSFLIYT
jgi:hypothetical protein